MCGIAGFFNAEESTHCLKGMISQLEHRGPDGFGLYHRKSTGLAHARLSIIDLAGGFQPVHNENKTVWVVFNGEIFNYIELRRELESHGHCFYTNSDTEVLVHAYEEYGVRFVKKLNGQFAFALWDEVKRVGFLARDRVGIQPLFFTQRQKSLYFGSEAKALFAVPGIQPRLDPKSIAQVFTFWTTLQSRTIFENIREVPPGHMYAFDESGIIQVIPYWDHQYGDYLDGDDLTGVLEHLMTESTSLRLRSDVPVAAYLSGGLDSSIITALVHKVQPEKLRTFSIGFEDAQFDESNFQQDMVNHLGVEHTNFTCTAKDIADIFPRVIFHTEKPILRTAPAPMMLLSNMVRENGYKVVLTGEGADEAFGGYDIFRETLVRQFIHDNPDSKLGEKFLSKLYPWMGDRISSSSKHRKAFFSGSNLDPRVLWFSHEPRWRTTSKSHTFFNEDMVEHMPIFSDIDYLSRRRINEADSLERAQYLEFKTLFQGYLISSQGDRMLMANGIEGRFPFLDPDVIDFANSLRPSEKVSGLNEKAILKNMARGLIPQSILDRKKQPYMAPDASSFFAYGGCNSYLDDVLSESALKDAGFFNPKKVALLRKKCGKGAKGFPDNMAFVGILSTQLLHQLFVKHFVLNDIAPECKFVVNVT